MGNERVHKDNSSGNYAFNKDANKNQGKQDSVSVPNSNKNSSLPQEIPTYSRRLHDSISAKIIQAAQNKTEYQVQKPDVKVDRVEEISPLEESGSDETNSSTERNIQAKLIVGSPGDMYEQEADKMAEQVMSMDTSTNQQQPIQRQNEVSENPVQAKSFTSIITPYIQRLTKVIQRLNSEKNQAKSSASLENRLASQTGGGSPLNEQTRSFMEPRFGVDFNKVRVHTDSTAVQMNQELGAKAFAHGSDIYFGEGQAPGNNKLTAHELTHVVQQGGAQRQISTSSITNKPQIQKSNKEDNNNLKQNTNQTSLDKSQDAENTLIAKLAPTHDPQQAKSNKADSTDLKQTLNLTSKNISQNKQNTSGNKPSTPQVTNKDSEEGYIFYITVTGQLSEQEFLKVTIMEGLGLSETDASKEIAERKWHWRNTYSPITQEELRAGRRQVFFNKRDYDQSIQRIYGINVQSAENIQGTPEARRQQFNDLTKNAEGILPQRILTATASQIYNEKHPESPVSLANAAYNNPEWDLILDRLLRERELLNGLRDDIKQALGGQDTFDGFPRSYQQLLRISRKLNQLSPEVLRTIQPLNSSNIANPEGLNAYEQSIDKLLSSSGQSALRPDGTNVGNSSQTTVVEPPQTTPIQQGGMKTQNAEKDASRLREILSQLIVVDKQPIMLILNQSPEIVQQIVKEYDAKYNTLSGKGLFVDLKNKLDGIDLGGRRYWEFVVAQFKRAGIAIPADILQNQNLEKLEYIRQNDQGIDKDFQIIAKPENPIVAAQTQITYTVERLKAEVSDKALNYQYQWYILNDPETVKNNPGVPARYDHYNVGNTWENAEWKYPGNHKVICRAQVNERPPIYLEYQQTVLPRQAALDDAFNQVQIPADPEKQAKQLKTYRQVLLNAEQQKGSNPLDPKVKEQLKAQSDALDEKLKSTEGLKRHPIKAVHLTKQGGKTFPLNVFLTQTEDRIGSPWAGRYTWTLVDITSPTDHRMSGEYKGMGHTHQEAIQAAIKAWDSANRYYPGVIKLQVPAGVAGEVIQSQFDTDGNNFWDSLSQFLDAIGFVTGIAAIITSVNPAISVPLALISMATSSAGAAIRLVQRRVEGRQNATEDTLDILTIVGNVLGGIWLRGASVRNVRWGNVNISEGILIGQLVTDGSTGIILNATYIKRYQEILAIKDPQERTDKLVKLLQEATLANGMLLISITGTVNDLKSINRLSNTSETIDVDNQTPTSRPTEETQTPTSRPPEETQTPTSRPPEETQTPTSRPPEETQTPTSRPTEETQTPTSRPPEETQTPTSRPTEEPQTSNRPTEEPVNNVKVDFTTTKELTDAELKAYLVEADNDWKKLQKKVLSQANNTPLMLQFTAYRKRVFKSLVEEVRKAIPGIDAQPHNKDGIPFKDVVAGSEQPSSDYDATFISKTGNKRTELDAVVEFNRRFREIFGKESGTVFDTNVYTAGHMLESSLGDTLDEILALRKLEEYLELPDELIKAQDKLNGLEGNARNEVLNDIKEMEELLPQREQLIKKKVEEINKLRKANPNHPKAEIEYNNIDDIDVTTIKRQTEQTSERLRTEVSNERQRNRVSEPAQKQLAANQDVMALLKQRRNMNPDEWSAYRQNMLNSTNENLKAATAARLDQTDLLYTQSLRELNQKIVELNQNKPPEKQVIGNDQKPETDSEKIRNDNVDAELEAYNRLYEKYLLQAQDIRDQLENYRAIRNGEKQSTLTPNQVPTEIDQLIDQLTLQLDEIQSKALFFANEAYHTGGAAEHIVLGQQLKLDIPLEVDQYLVSINEQVGFAMEQAASDKTLGKALWKSSKYMDRVNDAITKIKEKSPNLFNSAAEEQISKMNDLFTELVKIKKEKGQYYGMTDEQKSAAAVRVAQDKGFNLNSIEDLRSEILKFNVEINTQIRNAKPDQYNINPSQSDNRSSYIPNQNHEQSAFRHTGNNIAQSPVKTIELPEFG
jgi:hypothetical protein